MNWIPLAETWQDKAFGLVWASFWFALIFILLALAVKLAKRYREHGSLWGKLYDSTAHDSEDPGELLTKFRELHSRGTLSDAEYRTIKTKLASQIAGGLKDSPPETPSTDDES